MSTRRPTRTSLQILRLVMQVPQPVPVIFVNRICPLMAEGIPDRNALSSGVFASFAESSANFAVKDFGLRDVQGPQILNRKVRRGLRKGRKGTRNEIRHPFPVRRLLRGYNWLVEFAV